MPIWTPPRSAAQPSPPAPGAAGPGVAKAAAIAVASDKPPGSAAKPPPPAPGAAGLGVAKAAAVASAIPPGSAAQQSLPAPGAACLGVADSIAAAHAGAAAGAGAGAGAVKAAAADGDEAVGDARDEDDAVHATAMLVRSVMVYRDAKDAFDAATKGHTKPSERAAELLRICKDRADEGENVTDAFQRLIGGEDGLHEMVCDAYKVDPVVMRANLNPQHKRTWEDSKRIFVGWHNSTAKPGVPQLELDDAETGSDAYKAAQLAYSAVKYKVNAHIKAVWKAFNKAAELDQALNGQDEDDVAMGAGSPEKNKKGKAQKKKKKARSQANGNGDDDDDQVVTQRHASSALEPRGERAGGVGNSWADEADSLIRPASSSSSSSWAASTPAPDHEFALMAIRLAAVCEIKLQQVSGLVSSAAAEAEPHSDGVGPQDGMEAPGTNNEPPQASAQPLQSQQVGVLPPPSSSSASDTDAVRVKWLQQLSNILREMPIEFRDAVDQHVRTASSSATSPSSSSWPSLSPPPCFPLLIPRFHRSGSAEAEAARVEGVCVGGDGGSGGERGQRRR